MSKIQELLIRVITGNDGSIRTQKVVGVDCGRVTLVNLTPHPILIRGEDDEELGPGVELVVPPSGFVARAQMKTLETERFTGFTARTVSPVGGEFPEPDEGVVYVVSALVAQALKERPDVYAPDTDRAVRNEQGQVIAVPGLVKYA